MIKMTCPGCGRPGVEVLRPRTLAAPGQRSGRRPPRPWRRKAHAPHGGDLGSANPPPRCRYPLPLSPTELADVLQEDPCT